MIDFFITLFSIFHSVSHQYVVSYSLDANNGAVLCGVGRYLGESGQSVMVVALSCYEIRSSYFYNITTSTSIHFFCTRHSTYSNMTVVM